jgi:hypothetical protein
MQLARNMFLTPSAASIASSRRSSFVSHRNEFSAGNRRSTQQDFLGQRLGAAAAAEVYFGKTWVSDAGGDCDDRRLAPRPRGTIRSRAPSAPSAALMC